MAMVLTDEYQMLRDAARGFLTGDAPISQLRGLRDGGSMDGFDRSTWAEMAKMGWAGVLVPEGFGGSGMDVEAAGLLMEEMGRTLTASPFLSTAVLGSTTLEQFGSTDQKNEWLPKIADGSGLLALASDEGRRHRPSFIKVSAKRVGNGFSLSGVKPFVLDGGTADALIVAARTSGAENDADGITLFLVPRTAKGVQIERRDMVDSRHAARIVFDGVELTADAVIGEVDSGYTALEHILNVGRAVVAAEMSGSAQECLGRTVSYLQERDQFGSKIGSFQGLQHRAAHLYTEIELGRSLVMKALRQMSNAPDQAALLVSAAKAKLGKVAVLAGQEAVQMHGGIGMTDEFDIGFFLKRVRVADATFGDSNFHTERFAQIRGY